jgi:hypothetical protein
MGKRSERVARPHGELFAHTVQEGSQQVRVIMDTGMRKLGDPRFERRNQAQTLRAAQQSQRSCYTEADGRCSPPPSPFIDTDVPDTSFKGELDDSRLALVQ